MLHTLQDLTLYWLLLSRSIYWQTLEKQSKTKAVEQRSTAITAAAAYSLDFYGPDVVHNFFFWIDCRFLCTKRIIKYINSILDLGLAS